MRTYYVEGKRQQKAVVRTTWTVLGFSDSMSLDQARARAGQLNGENSIKRKEQQSLAGIAARVERDRLHHSVFIPEDLNQQFIQWLEENTSGSPNYIEKVKIIWGTVKKSLIDLKLTPDQFADNKKKIFRYLSSNQVSPDYARKQLSLMNQYGKFCARIIGKWYEPIPFPTGIDREFIADAFLDSGKKSKTSEPLDIECLQTLKAKLTQREYNWMHVSLWFGLRPSEITMILEGPNEKKWKVVARETDDLWVYQPKLTSIPRDKRWKLIPILFEDQRTALATLISREAEPPTMAKLSRSIPDMTLTRYAGRKGFLDLMLSLGQDLNNASLWLGHTNIERTLKSYKNRLITHISKIS